ncbi:MAG: Dabb family protein [Fibrobacter sp.]|nr:Dabb family protein [Fibrobacter sp.]
MIRHIVYWKLKAEAEGNTAKVNGQKMVDAFHALEGKIPGLVSIESGLNFNKGELGNSDVEFDIALDTTFRTREALDFYQNHPDHQAIVSFVKKVVSERRAVDFEF